MDTPVHFMGIGGVGMAGVAYLLKAQGRTVSGCDKYASPRTQWLTSAGIPVSVGHSPAHIAGHGELIVTPAVPKDAPELAAAQQHGLRIRYRGEVLAELVSATTGIAICGTHGKTTTSTFTTKLLRALGTDPSWCIGGETGTLPVAGVGTGPLVVEADESDGTLALYHAQILVVMNMDYDHPEHFKSLEAYRTCYATAMSHAHTVIKAWELDTSDFPELPSLVLGHHNVINARAAIEVALRLGYSHSAISAVLPTVLAELPDRRFQTVAATDTLKVITDYAHHPKELQCAVEMARALQPRRLRVLFQPHRYTRTKALCQEFPAAFAAADEVVLIPVYAAFEQPLPGGDIADLYAAFRAVQPRGQSLLLARSAQEAWRHALLTSEPDDLILLAGAGDIIQLVPRVQADLADTSTPVRKAPRPLAPLSFFRTGGVSYGGGAHHVVGMGSNTWFSDCATDDEIVKPDLPKGASLQIPWMAGIPGTIGGWAKMNAGAFGHSISEVIQAVVVDGRTIPAADCGFGYRTSSLTGLITDVIFDTDALARARADQTDYLSRRHPFPPRTCGSVFKNPAETPAGRLLEEAGAKQLHVGGASVWQGHANVIVAGENCTSSDILALARLMARAVFFKFGIWLEPEIRGLQVVD